MFRRLPGRGGDRWENRAVTTPHPTRKFVVVVSAAVVAIAIVVSIFAATNNRSRPEAIIFAPHTGSSFTIAVIGDSWSAGAGSDTNTSFSSFGAEAARELGVKGVIFAARGTGYVATSTAGGVYRERLARVAAVEPDLVVVQGSVNDTRQSTPDDVGAASKQLFSELRELLPNAVIVATGPMDAPITVPQQTIASAAAIRESALETDVHFVDPVGERWLPLDDDLFSDGLHPNQAGYDLIAARLADALRPYLR